MLILTPVNRQGERTVIMQSYQNLNSTGLEQELRPGAARVGCLEGQGLKLNMAGASRGARTGHGQRHTDCPDTAGQCISDGIDARNYGELAGLPAARRYWADVLGAGWKRPLPAEAPA